MGDSTVMELRFVIPGLITMIAIFVGFHKGIEYRDWFYGVCIFILAWLMIAMLLLASSLFLCTAFYIFGG